MEHVLGVSMSPENIGAIAEIVMAIAVFFGVIISLYQLRSWRQEQLAREKADAAGALLIAAYMVCDGIHSLRWGFRPAFQGQKPEDFGHPIEEKLAQHQKDKCLDHDLRHAEIIALARIGDKGIQEFVASIRDVRTEILAALWSSSHLDQKDSSDIVHEERKRCNAILVRGGDDDYIRKQCDAALDGLTDLLTPCIQLKK